MPAMPINWHAALWRGLSAEARNAAHKIRHPEPELGMVLLAASYIVKAVRAERAEKEKRSEPPK